MLSFFEHLPDEVILTIFALSSRQDLARLAQVNKNFNNIAGTTALALYHYKLNTQLGQKVIDFVKQICIYGSNRAFNGTREELNLFEFFLTKQNSLTDQKDLLQKAKVSLTIRTGRCGEQSSLGACYLLAIGYTSFKIIKLEDYVCLAIGLADSSDLMVVDSIPEEAVIIDPWADSVYSARKFHEKREVYHYLAGSIDVVDWRTRIKQDVDNIKQLGQEIKRSILRSIKLRLNANQLPSYFNFLYPRIANYHDFKGYTEDELLSIESSLLSDTFKPSTIAFKSLSHFEKKIDDEAICRPSMKIHYLFDVDDTLTKIGETQTNIMAIDFLIKREATISLLTKMDPTDPYSKPLRSELIKYLSNLGIQVENVYTHIDLLFQQAVKPKTFRIGEAYTLYMKPVEEAVELLKKRITKEEFNLEKMIRDNKQLLTMLQFALDQKWLKGTDTYDSLSKNKSKVDDDINNYLLNHFLEDAFVFCEIDFTAFHFIFIQLRSKSQSLSIDYTINDLVTHYLGLLSGIESSICTLTSDQVDAINHYYHETMKYKNQRRYIDLILEKKEERIIYEGKDAKGKIYEQFVSEHVCENDVVIFVDDNPQERESVANMHSNKNFRHELLVSPPPEYGCFTGESYLIPQAYNDSLVLYHLRYELLNHLQDSTKNKISLSHCIDYLKRFGLEAKKNENFVAAFKYFKLAHLFSASRSTTTFNDKSLFSHLIQIHIEIEKQDRKKVILMTDNLFVDTLYSSIINVSGFSLRFELCKLNAKIHEKLFTHVYVKNKTFFSFISRESTTIDNFFTQKLVGQIKYLTGMYPDEKIKCINFLKELQSKVISSSYKDHLSEEISALILLEPNFLSNIR